MKDEGKDKTQCHSEGEREAKPTERTEETIHYSIYITCKM